MSKARAFRGFRFPAEVILWEVRWYLQFPVSYRDVVATRARQQLEPNEAVRSCLAAEV